jgi:hypothetical protein
MANLTATQLLKAITKSQVGIMGDAEMRTWEHSLLAMLLKNDNSVFQNLTALKQSDEQPTKAILFNRNSIASGTAKSATHAAAGFADSFEKDIAFIKRVQKWKVSYKMADNNQFSYEEILQHNIKNALINIYEDLSSYNTAWIDTNRSQVGTDSIMLFDETTNDQFDNVSGDKDRFFDYMKAAMRKNKYRPMYDVVGDQVNAAEFRRLSAQGAGNSANQTYQMPGLNYIEEEQLTASASGSCYAWKSGMVGMTTWNEPQNLRGLGDPGANEGLFTTFDDQVMGMRHDLHVMRSLGDTSGSGGHLQDVVDEYEMTTIFTTQGAFESTATASPIFKFVQG